MDLLSELLRDVRIAAVAVGAFRLCAPYHLELSAGVLRAFSFTVLDGECLWRCADGLTHRLHRHDSVLVLRPVGCALASNLGALPRDWGEVWRDNRLPLFDGARDMVTPLRLQWGGGGQATEVLGLAFSFEQAHHASLLNAWPAALIVRSGEVCDAVFEAALAGVLAEGLRPRPGHRAMAVHHAQAVLLSLLRAHAAGDTGMAVVPLQGLRDRHIAAALQAVHAQPGAPWSVERLARAATLSRSAFAERFTAVMDTSPMAYVAALRVRLACEQLAGGGVAVAQLAESLGYASERAFRAAFLRHVGQSPSVWRRALRSRVEPHCAG